ncbi:hypothetical protein FOL47_001325 [Perkinsus chesapeaki]|uniref:Uncharacterized protein n=1 Tax=Perkinsus chesapeaki TaxID=330153 RepID=A0A7J6MJE1_PERCH|nr:hypothetical protein FOL47_001325 [Perkinsus chesapeaki]
MARLIEGDLIEEHVSAKKKVYDWDDNNVTKDEFNTRVTREILRALNTTKCAPLSNAYLVSAAAEILSPLLESSKETADALAMCSTQQLRDRLGQELEWQRERAVCKDCRMEQSEIQSAIEKTAKQTVKNVNQTAEEFYRVYSEVDLGYMKAVKMRWTEIRDYQAKGARAMEAVRWLLEGCKGGLERLEEMEVESTIGINDEKQYLNKGAFERALAQHSAIRNSAAKELTESFAKVKILFPPTRKDESETKKSKTEPVVRTLGSKIHASSESLYLTQNLSEKIPKDEETLLEDAGFKKRDILAESEELESENMFMKTHTFDSEDTLVKSDTFVNKETLVKSDTFVNEETLVKSDTFVNEETLVKSDTFASEETLVKSDTLEDENMVMGGRRFDEVEMDEAPHHSPTNCCIPPTEHAQAQDAPGENMALSRSTSKSDVTELIFEHESRSSSRSGMSILASSVLRLSESTSSCRSGVNNNKGKVLPSKPQWSRRLVNSRKESFGGIGLRPTCPWRQTEAKRCLSTVPVHQLSLYGELSESFIHKLEEERSHTLRAQHLPSQLSKGLAAASVGSHCLGGQVSVDSERVSQYMAESSIPSTRGSLEALDEPSLIEEHLLPVRGSTSWSTEKRPSDDSLYVKGNGTAVRVEETTVKKVHSVRAPAVGPKGSSTIVARNVTVQERRGEAGNDTVVARRLRYLATNLDGPDQTRHSQAEKKLHHGYTSSAAGDRPKILLLQR